MANSTASSERQGPSLRMTSVLKKPMTVSAKALGVGDRDVLDAAIAVVDQPAFRRPARVRRLFQSIEHKAGPAESDFNCPLLLTQLHSGHQSYAFSK